MEFVAVRKIMNCSLSFLLFTLLVILASSCLMESRENLASPEISVNQVSPESDDFSNQNKQSDDFQEKLRRIERAYRSLSSITLKGNTVQSLSIDGENKITEFGFELSFDSKQDRVTLDWEEEGKAGKLEVFASNASLQIGNERQDFESPMWGLAAASSSGQGGFKFEVVNVLLGTKFSRQGVPSFQLLTDLAINGDEEVNGHSCFLLSGMVEQDSKVRMTYWIDSDEYLIRQFKAEMFSESGDHLFSQTAETYNYVSYYFENGR